jgi:hypothetical protein
MVEFCFMEIFWLGEVIKKRFLNLVNTMIVKIGNFYFFLNLWKECIYNLTKEHDTQ